MVEAVQERGKLTRGAVLTAARELFGEQGYDGTSLEAILARAGVKRGALYHHFASKQAIFDAVVDGMLGEVAAALDETYDPEADPVLCLREGCHAWLDYASTPPVRRIVLLDAPVVLGWQRWRELDDQHFEASMARDLERAGAPGGRGDSPVGPSLIAGLLIAGVNEMALRIPVGGGRKAALTEAHAAVDLMVDRLVVGRL